MGTDNKRKHAEGGSGGSGQQSKKSKRGTDGKWQTTHQLANMKNRVELGQSIEVGDSGFWVTCQRGLEKKAMSEMTYFCDDLGETMYDIEPHHSSKEQVSSESQESKAVEVSIEEELRRLKEKPKQAKSKYTFLPVPSALECVFFMKVRDPVNPVEFVYEICNAVENSADSLDRKLKHVNRLSPVINIGKSLEHGIEKIGREQLSRTFWVTPEAGNEAEQLGGSKTDSEDTVGFSYAIRPNVRANSVISRDDLIERVAALVDQRHKVNLGDPDKVIIAEITKNHCGMSVVDGQQYKRFRKFNINEIYKLSNQKRRAQEKETGSTNTEGGQVGSCDAPPNGSSAVKEESLGAKEGT